MTEQYTKAQMVACREFQGRRDLVAALLEDGKTYTKQEVKRLLDQFLKGKVN